MTTGSAIRRATDRAMEPSYLNICCGYSLEGEVLLMSTHNMLSWINTNVKQKYYMDILSNLNLCDIIYKAIFVWHVIQNRHE